MAARDNEEIEMPDPPEEVSEPKYVSLYYTDAICCVSFDPSYLIIFCPWYVLTEIKTYKGLSCTGKQRVTTSLVP